MLSRLVSIAETRRAETRRDDDHRLTHCSQKCVATSTRELKPSRSQSVQPNSRRRTVSEGHSLMGGGSDHGIAVGVSGLRRTLTESG